MPPCLNFSRKACCVFLMEGKPLLSANKAQRAYFKSLAQFAKKSQVANLNGCVKFLSHHLIYHCRLIFCAPTSFYGSMGYGDSSLF